MLGLSNIIFLISFVGKLERLLGTMEEGSLHMFLLLSSFNHENSHAHDTSRQFNCGNFILVICYRLMMKLIDVI